MAGMKFLERSRSQRDKEQTSRGRKIEKPQTQQEPKKPKRNASKRKSIFPFAMSTPVVAPAPTPISKPTTVHTTTSDSRPKSANSRKSFHRPRTADGQDPYEQMPMPFDTMDIKAGDDTFSFPTPSPRLPPPRRSGTFRASPSPLTVGEPSPRIGIALGSPTNAPQWGRTHTTDHVSRTLPQRPKPVTSRTWDVLASIPEPPRRPLKKSKSAWKTLGGLFKSKHSRQPIPEPFYQVDTSARQLGTPPPHQAVERVGFLDSATSSPAAGLASPGSITSHHSRTPSLSRGMARFEARAEADRVSFMTTIDSKITRGPGVAPPRMSILQPPQLVPRLKESESGRLGDVSKASGVDRITESNALEVPIAIPRTPKLDMDFPDASFERYSVMFEKLLEPKPSLLERRQSKLKRLNSTKKDGTGNSLVPQRSLTSPHLSRMPSLSIKVSDKQDATTTQSKKQTQQVAPAPAPVAAQIPVFHRPRPLKRSATAPTLAVSPVNARFAVAARAPSPDSPSTSSPLYGENSLPPTPTTIADSDSLIPVLSHDTGPIIPRIAHPEPSWDMLTSHPPSKRSMDMDLGTGEHHRDPRYLRVKSPEDLERQMVQVSVARQVSVSKARRQVQNASEVKQPLRPRVVELGKNRKSTVVLIESAD